MPPGFDILFDEAAIAARIEALAEELAPAMAGDWTIVALLQGAMPMAVDLMRALARRDVHPILDCLWLESYADARTSAGRVVVRADLSRPIAGRGALILDDVLDSGRTIAFARAHVLAKGAAAARVCVLTAKPGAATGAEHIGFPAPDRYLLGYGMDDAGLYRGLPFIAALKA